MAVGREGYPNLPFEEIAPWENEKHMSTSEIDSLKKQGTKQYSFQQMEHGTKSFKSPHARAKP